MTLNVNLESSAHAFRKVAHASSGGVALKSDTFAHTARPCSATYLIGRHRPHVNASRAAASVASAAARSRAVSAAASAARFATADAWTCVEIKQCVGCAGIATPSSRRRVDGGEDDATIQHESAVKF